MPCAILVILFIGGGMWWLIAPYSTFLREFAALIEAPRIRFGVAALLSRDSGVMGRYKGRRVALTVQQPVEDTPGEVRLALEANAPAGAPWKDSLLVSRNAAVSRATFDLEGKYDLILSTESGWLVATWRPLPGRRFPGRFDEARWRNTLAQMLVVTDWLEQ
jgi:hypothetical protein